MEIYGITQDMDELLFKYWEHYQQLYACFPHHQIFDQILTQYFYSCLLSGDRAMIDGVIEGAFVDKTHTKTHQLISIMSENSQHFVTIANSVIASNSQEVSGEFKLSYLT